MCAINSFSLSLVLSSSMVRVSVGSTFALFNSMFVISHSSIVSMSTCVKRDKDIDTRCFLTCTVHQAARKKKWYLNVECWKV